MCLLRKEAFAHYVEQFNSLYAEEIVNAIPDGECWDWMLANVPFFECSDGDMERIYYFRWWIYRKHIKRTPDGFVVTEFLPEVGHGGKHNTINCPVGHHLYEGRWINAPEYLDDYCRFMLRGGGNLHADGCWFADAIYPRHFVHPNRALLVDLLEDLQKYYLKWEERGRGGLFHYTPWMDGMEFSVSGNKEELFRPTFNSYMYADALAIAKIAELAGNKDVAATYREKASAVKTMIQDGLWNGELEFFATLDLDGNFTPVGNPVREAVGYVPWYFALPDPGYESAWRHINDPEGFSTPVGLTTAEIRHPLFLKINPERMASWDGGVWPFATSQTLTAMQILLREYNQPHVTAADYIRELHKYAASHLRDGKPSICEVIRDPYVPQMCGSEHYNHSTYCDLVITGAAGLIPREDNTLEIAPLFPDEWDYFCLDGVRYHDRSITIAWDRTGARYGIQGLQVCVDGELRHSASDLSRVTLPLAG